MTANLVAIDPSLISTGLCVNGKLFNYCPRDKALVKSGLTKWFRYLDHLVTYRFVEYHDFKTYSEGEVTKLTDYSKVTDMIVTDILDNIDPTKPTKVIIEGYSYSSAAGNLIDLVSFSTLLRIKIFKNLTRDLLVVSPSTLKLETAKLCYAPIIEKKKPVYKNSFGVAGGSFNKRDMCFAIIENTNWNDPYALMLRTLKPEFMEAKAIKKPVEDVNDAYLLYQLIDKLHAASEAKSAAAA